jgi:hypothetical protein
MSSKDWIVSDNLDCHIQWILAQLEPRTREIHQLIQSGVLADIFCFSAGKPPHPPNLSEETTARAAALSLSIDIDYYPDDDSD